jgi:hypothetical protein
MQLVKVRPEQQEQQGVMKWLARPGGEVEGGEAEQAIAEAVEAAAEDKDWGVAAEAGIGVVGSVGAGHEETLRL